MKYTRAHELYNIGLSTFFKEHPYDPLVWLNDNDKKEYNELQKLEE